MDQFKCHQYQQFLKDDGLLGLQDDQNVKHSGGRSIVNLKKNSPCFWQMLREIIKFKQDVITYLEALDNNSDIDRNETLGYFIQSHGYSELFQKAYLVIRLLFRQSS
ncbi:uncharacterized protein LOC107799014 [Nicotiana tabacum]|uniref:Uncharacterized protein LOC107799014 n=1 Tax=Nicotiana tabacum TaxID=4097 RepID=A0AC58T0X1_TOBAC